MIDVALLVLRFGIGIMFAAHGLQKTFGMFGGPGIQGFSNALSNLGFAPAIAWAYCAALGELIGGIFLVMGLGTRISSSLLFIVIVVAGLKVHASKGFFLSNGGFEYTFVIACACLALMLAGGGKFSVIKKF
ncbi:MAG: DoxX family protein [Candidatus Omnitrophica bacterium]|nr:DoxX family protein [Candidatus Omnitrophota bacterium]